MELPFDQEQFFSVFVAYNQAVWPAQWLLNALGLTAVYLALRNPFAGSDRVVAGILAFLWAWLALAYHVAFFADINPLAYAFAALSLAGSLILIWQGVLHGRLHFRLAWNARSYAGLAFIFYALLLYPALCWLSGHPYPGMPTFGLPCPTTLFTIGLLAFLERPYPRSPLAAPLLWSLVGSQGAFLLDVYPDFALLAAAGFGVFLLIKSGNRRDSARASIEGSSRF